MTTLTIDKKVSIGILWTMLGSFVGGVVYMANLNSNLLVATDTLREVKTAIERNTPENWSSSRSRKAPNSRRNWRKAYPI